MKFVVSSSELLGHIQSISRVINSKNTLPILDNILFDLKDNVLTLRASDLETTLTTKLVIDNAIDDGMIALPSKLLLDTLKEFPEQPLTIEINMETLAADIYTENGKFSVVGQYGEDFPNPNEIEEEKAASILMEPEVLLKGIASTLFATSEDELRPVMNGIFMELSTERVSFVASDSHKLVRYRRHDAKADQESTIILPKKPAQLLKNLLPKIDGPIELKFDEKNAIFSFGHFVLNCRLVEGQYPSYETVIPTVNPNRLIMDRLELTNALKRVSVFSNQASLLVKLVLESNQMTISAQDIDYSISAYERQTCQYEGEEMEIGFKSPFIVDILSNIASSDVLIELGDSSRAALITPYERDNEDEEVLMLIMPMML